MGDIYGKYLTINSDASHLPDLNRGGYGVMLRFRDVTHGIKGEFKDDVFDSNEAELKAVIIGFAVFFHKFQLEDIEYAVVNCDNNSVRDMINYKRCKNPKYQQWFKMLEEYRPKFKKLYAKDIKGHSSGQKPRDKANRWCDTASKEYMQRYRNERRIHTGSKNPNTTKHPKSATRN